MATRRIRSTMFSGCSFYLFLTSRQSFFVEKMKCVSIPISDLESASKRESIHLCFKCFQEFSFFAKNSPTLTLEDALKKGKKNESLKNYLKHMLSDLVFDAGFESDIRSYVN